MRLILFLREWRAVTLVGIVCLGVGVFIGRFTASVSRPRDVSATLEARYEPAKLNSDLLTTMLAPLTATPADDRESAANILPYCKLNLTLEVLGDTYNARNARMYARCAGFVFQMGMKREQLQVTPPVNCIFLPHDANGKQLVDAMIKYADVHPEELQRPFIAFARDALANEWPCK